MTETSPLTAQGMIDELRFPELPSSAIKNPTLHQTLAYLKAQAVARNDQVEASKIWQAETIAAIQRTFIAAFAELKGGNFYLAWCHLEQCEILQNNLRRHFSVADADLHRLNFIGRMIERWQDLYPYRVFFSPEFLKKKILCSICKKVITPRSHCGHDKGLLYDGEQCYHIVDEFDLLSISIVKDPVQRYSVAFASSEDGGSRDDYNYSNLKFVVDRVESPFHGWISSRTTRTLPASAVSHFLSTTICPCNSGKDFGSCCSGLPEITVPHLDIEFGVAPVSGLPDNELLY